MAQAPLPKGKAARIVARLKKGESYLAIARATGASMGTVGNVAAQHGLVRRGASVVAERPPLTRERLLKALKRQPMNAKELGDALHCEPRQAASMVGDLRRHGSLIGDTVDGRFELKSADSLERQTKTFKATREYWNHRYGLVGDNHLCNKHTRLDVLNAAYDAFEREGITTVFNTGNWIDGERRFTRPESIVRPGMDAQIEYMLENYPERRGITTHYIAGDDHEGWYQQDECIEIGRYLELKAVAGGRHDLKYLGYAEADVELQAPGGSAVARVVHPGGGSAYAISYTDQKRVESYQGGEKPQVEFVGHDHKYNAGYPREVFTFQTGCTCDQTLFMRKKRLQAMVGYLICEIRQDRSDGHIERVRHEWVPFFDRGFYEQRYR